MKKIKVFESFSGIGCQSIALRNIDIDFEVVGISEVDKYGLIAYDSIHNKKEVVEFKRKEEILKEIQRANIGYNFSTGRSEIPKDENELRKLYEAHIRSNNFGDIRLIDENSLPSFDLFTYSFPCKNISVAGQQQGLSQGSNTQSSLLWECYRIIKKVKPKYLLMENVKNLVGKKHIEDFEKWCYTLEELGYNNYWEILQGSDFGVPQNRERVMMVSILKEFDRGFAMPKKTNKRQTIIKDILEDEVDKSYFLEGVKIKQYSDKKEGLITHKASIMVNVRKYDINKENLRVLLVSSLKNKEYSKKDIAEKMNLPFTLVEHWFRSSQKGFSIPLADRWYELKNILDIESNEFDKAVTTFEIRENIYEKSNRVYDVKGIAPTLTATNSNEKILLEDGRIRYLTEKETWRIQGIQDEHFIKAKETNLIPSARLYERAGRGIVIPMLEEIFKNMLKLESEVTI